METRNQGLTRKDDGALKFPADGPPARPKNASSEDQVPLQDESRRIQKSPMNASSSRQETQANEPHESSRTRNNSSMHDDGVDEAKFFAGLNVWQAIDNLTSWELRNSAAVVVQRGIGEDGSVWLVYDNLNIYDRITRDRRDRIVEYVPRNRYQPETAGSPSPVYTEPPWPLTSTFRDLGDGQLRMVARDWKTEESIVLRPDQDPKFVFLLEGFEMPYLPPGSTGLRPGRQPKEGWPLRRSALSYLLKAAVDNMEILSSETPSLRDTRQSRVGEGLPSREEPVTREASPEREEPLNKEVSSGLKHSFLWSGPLEQGVHVKKEMSSDEEDLVMKKASSEQELHVKKQASSDEEDLVNIEPLSEEDPIKTDSSLDGEDHIQRLPSPKQEESDQVVIEQELPPAYEAYIRKLLAGPEPPTVIAAMELSDRILAFLDGSVQDSEPLPPSAAPGPRSGPSPSLEAESLSPRIESIAILHMRMTVQEARRLVDGELARIAKRGSVGNLR